MKIIFEQQKCIGCGSCQALCPKYFEMSENGKAELKGSTKNPQTQNEELDTEEDKTLEEAAESCPMQCIHIIKEKS